MHGVSLSIASTAPPTSNTAKPERPRPARSAEMGFDICAGPACTARICTTCCRFLHRGSADHVVSRVQLVRISSAAPRAEMSRPICSSTFGNDGMEFLPIVAPLRMLAAVDINNVYVSAFQPRLYPLTFLNAFHRPRVQFHMAGTATWAPTSSTPRSSGARRLDL